MPRVTVIREVQTRERHRLQLPGRTLRNENREGLALGRTQRNRTVRALPAATEAGAATVVTLEKNAYHAQQSASRCVPEMIEDGSWNGYSCDNIHSGILHDDPKAEAAEHPSAGGGKEKRATYRRWEVPPREGGKCRPPPQHGPTWRTSCSVSHAGHKGTTAL